MSCLRLVVQLSGPKPADVLMLSWHYVAMSHKNCKGIALLCRDAENIKPGFRAGSSRIRRAMLPSLPASSLVFPEAHQPLSASDGPSDQTQCVA